jgi:hypothetical protein
METTWAKADQKGRGVIRGARKGANYLVTAARGGWVVTLAPNFKVHCQIESPVGAWELRAASLQHFYDPSKTW